MVWTSRIGEIDTRPELKSKMLFASRTKQLVSRGRLKAVIYSRREMLHLI